MVLFNLLIYLVIAGIIWWAGNAILAKLSPWIAEPFKTLIQIVLIIFVAAILIGAVLQLAGGGNHLGLPMLRW